MSHVRWKLFGRIQYTYYHAIRRVCVDCVSRRPAAAGGGGRGGGVVAAVVAVVSCA